MTQSCFALIFYPYVIFHGERYALEAEQKSIGKAFEHAEWVWAEASKQLEEYRQTMQSDGQRIGELNPDALQTAAAEHARILADIKTALAGDPQIEAWLARATAGEEPPSDLRRRHPVPPAGRPACAPYARQALQRDDPQSSRPSARLA